MWLSMQRYSLYFVRKKKKQGSIKYQKYAEKVPLSVIILHPNCLESISFRALRPWAPTRASPLTDWASRQPPIPLPLYASTSKTP